MYIAISHIDKKDENCTVRTNTTLDATWAKSYFFEA